MKAKVFSAKKILLGGLVALLVGCSSGSGVYGNVACGVHPNATCVKKKAFDEEQINLAADALFQFDKYTANDLLEMGRQQLDALAQKLTNGYAEIESVTLVGHTDRLGSESYNSTLGLNRAKTVRDYLQSRGVNVNILAETAGESQPVTDGCYGVLPKSKLTACLQPDRRVVVTVLGVKKVKECTVNKERVGSAVGEPMLDSSSLKIIKSVKD